MQISDVQIDYYPFICTYTICTSEICKLIITCIAVAIVGAFAHYRHTCSFK